MRIRQIVLLLPLLSGCLFHHAEEAQAPLRSATRDSLLAADAARGDVATRQGLANAVATWLDSGVVYLRTGAPILYGRAAALTALGDPAPERSPDQWPPRRRRASGARSRQRLRSRGGSSRDRDRLRDVRRTAGRRVLRFGDRHRHRRRAGALR